MNRRPLLVAGAALADSLVGCLGHEEAPDVERSCPETWNVVLYTESNGTKAPAVDIRDSEAQVVFSDQPGRLRRVRHSGRRCRPLTVSRAFQ